MMGFYDDMKREWEEPYTRLNGKPVTTGYFLGQLCSVGFFCLFIGLGIGMVWVLYMTSTYYIPSTEALSVCQSLVPDGMHYMSVNKDTKQCYYANDTDVVIMKYKFDVGGYKYMLYKDTD